MASESLDFEVGCNAVLELSTKVRHTCTKHLHRGDGKAQSDIERLDSGLELLQRRAGDVRNLLNGPRGAKFMPTQEAQPAIEKVLTLLQTLDHDLQPQNARKTTGRGGVGAWKWPFRSTDVDSFVQTIAGCTHDISFRVQTAQEQQSPIPLSPDTHHQPQPEGTYLPMLNRQLGQTTVLEQQAIAGEIRLIVGSVALLSSPLSTSASSKLLGVPEGMVERRLDMLKSVLDTTSSPLSPANLLHPSFRDSMVDPRTRESNPFWVDEKEVHNHLANRCLAIMQESLEQNICNLPTPGTRRSASDSQKVDACLRYACANWTYHLEQAANLAEDGQLIYDFLQLHFLHWLEVLSLAGKAFESPRAIAILRSLPTVGNHLDLPRFLDDGLRFVRSCLYMMDAAPLQLYSSALIFAPSSSIVRQSFWHCVPDWIDVLPIVDPEWSECLQRLEGHTGCVTSVALSHDAAYIVSAEGEKASVRVWRTDTGECIQKLEGLGRRVSCIALSHDSKLVASSSYDTAVRIWRLDTGECIQKLEGHDDHVDSVAFSGDSTLIASASDDKTIRIWDVGTGKCIHELKGHTQAVDSIAFSGDSTRLASASYDETVRIWRVDSGECTAVLSGHREPVECVAFSHDSKLVASGAKMGTVRIWDADTGRRLRKLKTRKVNNIVSLAFSHDSTRVATGSWDRRIRLWSVATGRFIQCLEGHEDEVRSVAFSPDDSLLISGSLDHSVRIWSLLKTPQHNQEIERHSEPVRSVAISNDAALVATGSEDGTVRLWSTNMGKCIRTLKGHTRWITEVAFIHGSALVVSWANDHTIRIWRTDTGECTQVLKTCDFSEVAISPDSALIASLGGRGFQGEGRQLQIWRTDTGECIRTLNDHTERITGMVFTHDSTRVVSWATDDTIRIWRVDTGECIRIIDCEDEILSVAVSHDSALIASSGHDDTIRIWDADTGECIRDLDVDGLDERHEDLEELTFAPGNKVLMTEFGHIDINNDPDQLTKEFLANRDALPVDDGADITVDDAWLVYRGNRLLWLPATLRDYWKQNGPCAAFGSRTGRVVIIRFSPERLGELFLRQNR